MEGLGVSSITPCVVFEWQTILSFSPPFMKFTLTYDGELPPAGNKNKRTFEKNAIRNHISPQLAQLWRVHPALRRAHAQRVIPKDGFFLVERHHSVAAGTPNPADSTTIDLCEEVVKGATRFLPLVRSSYGTVCALSVLFMRQEPAGNVYQGGDLDNRIKTLLDALSVPREDQIRGIPALSETEQPVYCLLEDDSLLTGIAVETRRLLTRPGAQENEVRLIVDVDVRVPDARSYNTLFLGD
jgi:hypothetical protein